MRIAIVLDIICLAEMKSSIKRIILFDVEYDLVIAIDEDTIAIDNIHYLCLWLLAKRASRLYCDGLTDSARTFLEKAGITIHPLQRIRDHPILHALLLKDEEKVAES